MSHKPLELVVLSGKGGTGKTSVTASFAVLSGNSAIADLDVDAADLHLVLAPKPVERHDFRSGNLAVIVPEKCTSCGLCFEYCRFDAILRPAEPGGPYSVNSPRCEGCGVCVRFCPASAIDFPEAVNGEWFISETAYGPMIHARLIPGAENSGKLVTHVRKEAARAAEERGLDLILADGPPGVGCPVIASLTGADMVLVVTEPTVSGLHDMERVLSLARHFSIPALVSVNKWDINHEVTGRIKAAAERLGAIPAGDIRYDDGVTKAQIMGTAVVTLDTPAASDVRKLWGVVAEKLATRTRSGNNR